MSFEDEKEDEIELDTHIKKEEDDLETYDEDMDAEDKEEDFGEDEA